MFQIFFFFDDHDIILFLSKIKLLNIYLIFHLQLPFIV